MKAPSQFLLCEWVKASWAEVSTEMVKGSFTSYAIIAAANGSKLAMILKFIASMKGNHAKVD